MSSATGDIRHFWDERARAFGGDAQATLGDTGLRRLEIRTMIGALRRRSPMSVLDVGCGNGFSTRHAARALPHAQFTGVDYSPAMIAHASTEALDNVRFDVADALDPATLPDGPFDCVCTQRCIQNLPDWSQQVEAIEHLRRRLRPGGALLLMECSRDGVEQLNRMRVRLGRAPLQGIEPWHNTFLRDGQMIETFKARVTHFSATYMFLTKVLHPKLSRIAWRLPAVGAFGYDRLYTIEA